MTEEQLFKNRHSLSHIMTMAVLELYPDAGLGVGPVIDNGFYQDYDLPESISDELLPKIQKRMREIIKQGIEFKKYEMDFDKALDQYKDDPYKTELITDLKAAGEASLSFYKSDWFENLCKGPHVDTTKEIDVVSFKLTKIAGAYWRGDEKNKMLTRIYGVAFANKEDLKAHLKMLEEAKRRDHRKLGKDLDLFLFSEKVGPGLPLWTPKGTALRNVLDDFVWKLRKQRGYEKVEIPHVTKKDLYETSGHWEKFKDDLFRFKTREGHEFAMKPMNCPHHTQIFDRHPHSYRDMPQRYANSTMVYRDEQTGELHGLSRVRCITQDDAHAFVRHSQVSEEMLKIWEIIEIFYKAVGFEDLKVELSFHDPNESEKYLGGPEVWETAENALREIVKSKGVEAEEKPGEAAFYGPKIDFIAKDAIGRTWQVATIQMDMNMPERFDLNCIDENGEKERVVMIHAAIMGSIERFLSIIIEHHAGAFPLWMSPVQVRIASVGESHTDATLKLVNELSMQGIRAEADVSDATVGAKIRNAAKSKTPYTIIFGDKEKEGEDFQIRVFGSEEGVVVAQGDLVKHIQEKVLEQQG
ncbi:threonine--tRNA ligase [Candidatus Uhrbacteria bacterium]|jgi:threonyl-tRNA synthetase|nr:threonine--tRNA ligase [Candidatus Uhrbacteria bacterium]